MYDSAKVILKFDELYSSDLKTCSVQKKFQIKSICKYQDIADKADYLLDIKHKKITQCKQINHQQNPINQETYEILLTNPRKTWSELSSIAFPKQPKFVALITGTNGKTSIAWITHQIWQLLGIKSGYIGTLGIHCANYHIESLTTPDAAVIHYHLNKMAEHGIECVVIESSSIGLDQDRLSFVKADVIIFTNFSLDHLDYHQTMQQYLHAKLKILSNLKVNGIFLMHESIEKNETFKEYINNFLNQPANSGLKTIYNNKIQFSSKCNFMNRKWIFNIDNIKYEINNNLIGDFNGTNMTAAFMIVKDSMHHLNCHISNNDMLMQFNRINPVPGRMNLVNKINGCDIYVDFAHTPDALDIALATLRQHYQTIYLVFGCGGDRDHSKREKMGEVAHKLANQTIITNDNPRSEDPQHIANQISHSCPNATIILDRKEAIKHIIEQVSKFNQYENQNSAILVAGKGEERTQIFKNYTEKFYDPDVINELTAQYEHGSQDHNTKPTNQQPDPKN